MKWAGYVERMGDRRGIYRVLVGKPEERDHFGYPGVDDNIRWIILRWIFTK
jgi:hypothetical protein